MNAWEGATGKGCCWRPTVYAPSSTLLNLGHVELEEAVEPCDEFLTARLRRLSVSVSVSCVHGARWTKQSGVHTGQGARAYRDSPILFWY